MELNTYQYEASKFAQYRNQLYPILGLAEEAGEVLGKYAKAIRGDSALDKEAVAKELGDCLWMVSACAKELGWSLDDIAGLNLAKLKDRQNRGVVKGNGDNR